MYRSKTYKIVLKQIGNILLIQSMVCVIPVLVAGLYGEWHSLEGFLLSGLIIAGIGSVLLKGFKKSEDPQYQHILIIVAAGWLALAVLGSLPFYIIAWITPVEMMNGFIPPGVQYSASSMLNFRNPLHCFFESMSAYTTTGLSMADHERSLGKGLLFYRSFAQWVGGAGFVITTLAIFKNISGKGAILLYGGESTGIKLLPQVKETARAIWKVYVLVTVFSIVYLITGTMLILPQYPLADNIFNSVNHALAGQSTGGFSTLDDSIATFKSARMEILYLLPMILGSFSLPFLYKFIFEKRIKELWKDIQTRSLIAAFLLGSSMQVLLLVKDNLLSSPVREGVFQFISAMATTGWQTSDVSTWSWYSMVYIVFAAMFIGGASGATVGGIKMIRFLLIKKGLRWQINKAFVSNNTVQIIRFSGKTYKAGEMYVEFTKAAALAIMFFLMIMCSAFLTYTITGKEYSFTDALFESASAQATVGLSTGITNPAMAPILEITYIFQMWTGRLEIIPAFVLIRAVIWGTRPKLF